MLITIAKPVTLEKSKFRVTPITSSEANTAFKRIDALIMFLYEKEIALDTNSYEHLYEAVKRFLIIFGDVSVREMNQQFYVDHLKRKTIPETGILRDLSFLVAHLLTRMDSENVDTVWLKASGIKTLGIIYYGRVIFIESTIYGYYMTGDINKPLIEDLDLYKHESGWRIK